MLGKWIMGGFWGWVRSYSRCSLCFIECQKSFAIILCTHIVWKMLKAQSLKGVDSLGNPSPPSPTYELYCIMIWKHLCWGCMVIHLSICEPGFFYFFNFLFCETKILGAKNFKTLAKLVKSALEKHISPPNSPTFFFRRCQVLRIFYWELFFQVRPYVFACISCDMYRMFLLHFLWHVRYLSLFRELSHISILSLDKSHKFQLSLMRKLTRFNSLFWQVSHISMWVLNCMQWVFVDKIDLKFVQPRIGFTNA
jgi:hypothetical protein